MAFTTSWMWATNDGDTNGAFIDLDKREIQWFDHGIGCACSGSSLTQDYDSFLQGAALPTVPEDVLAEMHETVNQSA